MKNSIGITVFLEKGEFFSLIKESDAWKGGGKSFRKVSKNIFVYNHSYTLSPLTCSCIIKEDKRLQNAF
jgi:hypothetical protein